MRDEKVQLPGSPGRTLAEGEGRNNLIGERLGWQARAFRFVLSLPLGYASGDAGMGRALAGAEGKTPPQPRLKRRQEVTYDHF